MRRPTLAFLVVVAVLAAGCGGGSKAGSASGAQVGATIAPASALGFVAVNIDEGSTQWKNADALLSKFPIRDKLLKAIEKSLSDNNVNFSTDVRPLLGPELDLVLLKDAAGTVQVIAMTQPTDAEKFAALLEKGKTPFKHAVVDGWTIFSETQAALTAFQTEADKGKLADDGTYKQATADLPTETNITAYVNGATAISALKSALPQAGVLPTGQLEWLGAALSTQTDSVKLVGAVKSGQLPGQTFKSTLLSYVPSGALVVASFHGSAQLTQQLTQNPAVAQVAGQLQRLLGVGLTDLSALVEGEGALYVAAGIPFPEVTLILKQQHPAAAMATLNKVAAKAAGAFNGKLTDFEGVAGVKKLHLGGIAIYYGIVGGNLMISDAGGHLYGAAAVGTPLADDPVFTKAKNAAGLPDQSGGFLYLNLKNAIPLLEGFAQTMGTAIPPDVAQNLAPLQSFLAFATVDNGVAKFSALLQAR